MSEYEYHEFLAIDRPLTTDEIESLRPLSSRARITPTSFSVDYAYSSFRGDPVELVRDHFDIYVCLVSYGARRLTMGLPREAVRTDVLDHYCDEEFVSWSGDDERIVLDASFHGENLSSWVEGEGWIGSLSGLRDELLRGDERVLYLLWLAGIGTGLREFEEVEPPVPPGLGELSAAQSALASFLNIEASILAAAADSSPPLSSTPGEDSEFHAWLKTLDVDEKDALLSRVVRGEHAAVVARLRRRFRDQTGHHSPRSAAPRRDVEAICEAAVVHRAEAARLRMEEEERRRQERAARELAAQKRRVTALARRGPAVWNEVQELVSTTDQRSYDSAVRLLGDLRMLHDQQDARAEFEARLARIRREQSRKSSLIRRLDEAGLE